MRALPVFYIAVLLALGGLAGCTDDLEWFDASCDSTAECPLEEVCHVPTRACVEEPQSGLMGTFSCGIAEPAGLADQRGIDVLGTVGTERRTFQLLQCSYSETGYPHLALGLFVSDVSDDALTLTIDWNDVESGTVDLAAPDYFGQPSTATLWDMSHDAVYAHSAAGSLTLDGEATIGGVITGFLDVEMVPVTTDGVVYGVPCPRGMVDCGSSVADAYCETLTFTDGTSSHLCTHGCTTDADCAAVGDSVCVSELCTVSCDRCSSTQSCVDDETGREGCF